MKISNTFIANALSDSMNAKGMRKVAKQSRRDEPKGEPVEARFCVAKFARINLCEVFT
ncbi:hypothetical protein FACS1894116_01420 [Betaproteobacteria bacterium]|nr:hypothetical protein FACS1894116_01420 [Betaproteobacteria bacterium]GHU24928.1 hypothetical protein FACS189488_10680 [Betaproteobacteria bacterium]GHU28458.1 hypothetical protein FACS189497_03960 [Betaproteobacteria bacterium]